ncbi:type VI secretion system Vgr family protein [Microbulbifer sp. 2205BS26-8]|uniref:type VI secretion system Vgr family protein n=1 Tax=Microbulbifer sp. 2205BS26-8 TaxID=3064386 RepID=UPI00273E4306|nr:type VI secretion system tip protein TssI/VgrG [Microbulbifer sp. 2205BS26-8]MDP5210439.1 type VI secretion system tip protein TssI/VgrG [Microbulbifer sp. 2205BS26-8]
MLKVDSPVGTDALVATTLQGEEHISKLFHYEVHLISDNHAIAQNEIVGKPITVSIHHSETPRYINGFVTQFSLHDVNSEGIRCYSAIIQPGLWFTSLGSCNRIFEKKSAKQILEEVLGEYNRVIRLTLKLNAEYITREYCVQFDETDFEFVNRLMAEEGISYYFKHSDGQHELILCDDPQDFYDCNSEQIEYAGGGSHPTKNSINSWRHNFNYHSGGFELKDYSEFTATKDNKQQVKTTSKLNDAASYLRGLYGLNHFQADGEHKHKFTDNYHKALAERAMESQEALFDVSHGRSDCPCLGAGGRFLFDHPLSTEKGKYLVTTVHISAADGNNSETHFHNTFSCVPASVLPRPAPNICAKKIHSPQVAHVLEVKATASDSSQDPYTQLKVKFPWNSRQNSCWVRVMQSFAGKNWGANFVPRVNQEVIVNYINGDPDRPLITGAVYNGDNPGPNYTATQSGWKTEHEGSTFNELRFDDKGGSEEIYMEAGRDHTFVIHNDQSGKIENKQTLEVKQDRTITVTDGSEVVTIAKGDQKLNVDKGNQVVTIGSGNHALKISKGSQTTDAMGAIKISSKASIELKVGGSSIKLTPAGITIKGTMLSCKGDASAEVKGGGMLTLKGGVTMIN